MSTSRQKIYISTSQRFNKLKITWHVARYYPFSYSKINYHQNTVWFESPWFGAFHRGNDNWIFHLELGWWIYVANEAGFGRWFWNDAYGWCWTRESVYPFIWNDQTGNWLYKMKTANDRAVFWNYSTAMVEIP